MIAALFWYQFFFSGVQDEYVWKLTVKTIERRMERLTLGNGYLATTLKSLLKIMVSSKNAQQNVSSPTNSQTPQLQSQNTHSYFTNLIKLSLFFLISTQDFLFSFFAFLNLKIFWCALDKQINLIKEICLNLNLFTVFLFISMEGSFSKKKKVDRPCEEDDFWEYVGRGVMIYFNDDENAMFDIMFLMMESKSIMLRNAPGLLHSIIICLNQLLT